MQLSILVRFPYAKYKPLIGSIFHGICHTQHTRELAIGDRYILLLFSYSSFEKCKTIILRDRWMLYV